MIAASRVTVATRLLRRFNLRFPTLFLILGILTLINLLIPDPIPFIDEIGLAVLTVLFGMRESRKAISNPDNSR